MNDDSVKLLSGIIGLIVGVILMGAASSALAPSYEDGVYDHAKGIAVIDTLSNGETVITMFPVP